MTYTHQQVLPAHTRLGVYEIRDTLKISLFGISYSAWNHHLNEQVVLYEYFPYDLTIRGEDGLKVEPKLLASKEDVEYGMKLFLKEAEFLTQINHHNVAIVENVLQFNGTAYFVVGYQEGISLSEYGKLPAICTEVQVRYILVSILNALEQIHKNKSVHGGIHPGTIFLSKEGEPVLTEFAAARLGFASHIEKLSEELNSGYSALEQYGDAHESTPASDFYALGATIYYLITSGDSVSAPDRLLASSKNEPDPVVRGMESLNTIYSANLLGTITWMLNMDSRDRPQAAAEILTILNTKNDNDQIEIGEPDREVDDVSSNNRIEKDYFSHAAIVGIVIMISGGLWFSEKNVQLPENVSNQIVIKPAIKSAEPAIEIGKKVDQESGNEKVTAITEKISPEIVEQSAKVDGGTVSNSGHDRHQLEVDLFQEPVAVGVETDMSVSMEKSQVSSKKPVGFRSIKSAMAAAENAMREMRYTTPVGDSAFEFYQMVLITDPGNTQALSGLQKIVDKYIHLIEEAQEEGQTNTARVYLLRAQAVLPENLRLQSIHAKLNAEEVNH